MEKGRIKEYRKGAYLNFTSFDNQYEELLTRFF